MGWQHAGGGSTGELLLVQPAPVLPSVADEGALGSPIVVVYRAGVALDYFERIFETLDRTGVRYVVVGGVAVNLHGHQRFTKDLDLALELAGQGLIEALQALRDEGYRPALPVRIEEFADASIREQWIREKNMQVFQLYHDARRITVDIMVSIPVVFAELWQDAVDVPLERTTVKVASIEHLIRMKRHTGRPQDLVDVEALETIRDLLAEGGGT